jgi:hypothetical protein
LPPFITCPNFHYNGIIKAQEQPGEREADSVDRYCREVEREKEKEKERESKRERESEKERLSRREENNMVPTYVILKF